jgi:hypothetical protein
MSVALKAYLNSMSEREKKNYAQHIISFPSCRLKGIKDLDPDLWKIAQEIAKSKSRGDRRYVGEPVHRRH